jgi:hypothetical protein
VVTPVSPVNGRLALTTLLLGGACVVDSVGCALDFELVATVGLAAYLILAPFWAFCTGLILLRGSGPSASAQMSA